MTNLTNLQLALLSSAAARADGNLLPAPDSLATAPYRVRKAAGQLIAMGYADERAVAEADASLRAEGDTLVGAIISAAGRARLTSIDTAPHQLAAPTPHALPPAKRETKTALLIGMLSGEVGPSLDEVIAATGWLPHTARAAITILKTKKGYKVERVGERGASRYRIVAAG